ncbi:hypothetical protein [Micromonospora profundi]|uniref:hypothetical protein n=1 Tax=Micromonospora profundi TaxID=1420889 RepID=UPI003658E9FF
MNRADIANTAPATRRGRALIAFIAAAAFGPYLAPGIRTEQTAVYLAALLLLAVGGWVGVRLTGAGLVAVALHGGIVAVALLGVVLPPPNSTLYKPAGLSAGLDNLLLPLAVVFVVAMLAGLGADRAVMLRTVCQVTVWAMVINVGAAVASMGDAGAPQFLLMWRLGDDGESVADRAEQLGRYSGMFNQPAEAGLLYSVALIAAVYLYRSQPVRLAVVSLTLAVGGALCVSKVALLVGLPVAVWQIMRLSTGWWRRTTTLAGAGVALVVAANMGMLPRWEGMDFLLRLIPASGTNQDVVALYTAGRVGDSSSLSEIIGVVASTNLWTGVGAAGLRLPYDNGWVEALVVAGAVGVVLQTLLLVALTAAWLAARSRCPESPLAGGLVAVVVGASFGLPALTANRAATIVWLMLALLLIVHGDGDTRSRWWARSGRGSHRDQIFTASPNVPRRPQAPAWAGRTP